MSRIIEETPIESTVICPHCRAKIGYNLQEDAYSTPEGKEIICPNCNDAIQVEKFQYMLPFPEGYYSFHNDADLNDEEIERMVKRCVQAIVQTDELDATSGTGDTTVHVHYYPDDEIIVINVSKGYWEANLSYEEAKKLINS